MPAPGGIRNISAQPGDFPAAQSEIVQPIDITDCSIYPSFQQLVTFLQASNATACTIKDGTAYTEASTVTIANNCEI